MVGTAGHWRSFDQSPPLEAEQERLLLDRVEGALAAGLELKRWWERIDTGQYARSFDLARTFNRPDRSFGFFDQVLVGGRQLPVMGNFQEMFYDQPKVQPLDKRLAAAWMRDQIREFVLHYFMRVSDFRQPEAYVVSARTTPSPWLQPLSWCSQEDISLKGFGFQQLYYKRKDTGAVGQFADHEKFAIIDLREIGPRYEWIVVKVCIFDFNIPFKPFGPGGPQLLVPLQEDSYLVLSSDFILNEDEPAAGVLGRYGLGYAFIKNPVEGLLAYGPGEFEAAIELIHFRVGNKGRVDVSMTFVANRPERIVNLPLNPVNWAFRFADLMSLGTASRFLTPFRDAIGRWSPGEANVDPVYGFISLANLMTSGLAAQDLCISRDQLDRDFLVRHFMQHYQAIAGSLATWRLVCDWLDTAELPEWIVTGKSG